MTKLEKKKEYLKATREKHAKVNIQNRLRSFSTSPQKKLESMKQETSRTERVQLSFI
jgi:hypothetical protein